MPSHFPELEAALIIAQQNRDFDQPPSVRKQFCHASADSKRRGAARALSFASQFRAEAAPYLERAAVLRGKERELFKAINPQMLGLHLYSKQEMSALEKIAETARLREDTLQQAKPFIGRAENCERDAAWLKRSADWQDLYGKVKKALSLS